MLGAVLSHSSSSSQRNNILHTLRWKQKHSSATVVEFKWSTSRVHAPVCWCGVTQPQWYKMDVLIRKSHSKHRLLHHCVRGSFNFSLPLPLFVQWWRQQTLLSLISTTVIWSLGEQPSTLSGTCCPGVCWLVRKDSQQTNRNYQTVVKYRRNQTGGCGAWWQKRAGLVLFSKVLTQCM
jgi:hypothetical protein